MSRQAPSTADAPEAARAAGECMTASEAARAAGECILAAREEAGISQESDSASTSSNAESASPLPLSDVMENTVQADDTESAESSGTTLKHAPLANGCCSTFPRIIGLQNNQLAT